MPGIKKARSSNTYIFICDGSIFAQSTFLNDEKALTRAQAESEERKKPVHVARLIYEEVEQSMLYNRISFDIGQAGNLFARVIQDQWIYASAAGLFTRQFFEAVALDFPYAQSRNEHNEFVLGYVLSPSLIQFLIEKFDGDPDVDLIALKKYDGVLARHSAERDFRKVILDKAIEYHVQDLLEKETERPIWEFQKNLRSKETNDESL